MDLTQADRTAIEAVLAQLETAWNAADGTAFGAPFADDADFITIRAEHVHGRQAIAGGHAAIFKSIYAGSSAEMELESARLLRPDVALVHARSVLDAPSGPLVGKHAARFSMVLTKEHGGWQIASFHNTVEPPPAPPR